MPNQQAAFRSFVAARGDSAFVDMAQKMRWAISEDEPGDQVVAFSDGHVPTTAPAVVRRVAQGFQGETELLGEALEKLKKAVSECSGLRVEIRAPKGQKRVLMRISSANGDGDELDLLTLLVYQQSSVS